MPPLAPPVEKDGSRQRHAAAAAAAAVVVKLRAEAQRSASFQGRGAVEQQQRHLLKQRPRTQPDLFAGVRGRSFRTDTADGGGAHGRPAPSKVLVTVSVRQSMWPLQVMACAEWRVANLVAAAVELYIREGRRPLLPSADPSAFGLHYSQFSLQSLDPEEKLMELGSRSFFLCPKAAATAAASTVTVPSTCSCAEAGKAISPRKPGTLPPWLGFMHYWPLL